VLSRWFWSRSRVTDYFTGVPRGKLLLLDLHGEKHSVVSAPDRLMSPMAALGVPFIFCLLHNFGGSQAMAGELRATVAAAQLAAGAAGKGMMVGVGITMEGIEQNELLYDATLALAWRTSGGGGKALLGALAAEAAGADGAAAAGAGGGWIGEEWVPARYGTGSGGAVDLAQAARAWQGVAAVVYSRPPGLGGFGAKSVLEARPPSWKADTCARGGFQPSAIHYPPGKLHAPAAALLAAAARKNHHPTRGSGSGRRQEDLPEAFLYDAVDVTRQVLTDAAIAVVDEVLAAHKKCLVARLRGGSYAKQQLAARTLLRRKAARLSELLADFDALLGSHRRWQAGWRWLAHAKTANQQRQARTLITRWDEAGHIMDYASRQWSGMAVRSQRWETWLASLHASCAGKPWDTSSLEHKLDQLEMKWIGEPHSSLPAVPEFAPGIIEKAQALLDKWGKAELEK